MFKRILIGVGIGFGFFALLFVGAITSDNSPAAAKPQSSQAGQNYVMSKFCIDSVRQKLHDPKSAQFPNPNEVSIVDRGNGQFLASFEGRARNGVGAMRLQKYECGFVRKPEGGFSVIVLAGK